MIGDEGGDGLHAGAAQPMLGGVERTYIAPGFLVAVPQLGDPNFQHSVVLMLEHTAEGALGLVVNRPGEFKLSEVAKQQGMPHGAEARDTSVFVGGPVQTERGFVLHDRPDVDDSVRLFGPLFVSSSLDSLRTLLVGPTRHYRLCLGYAGWGPGQVEREIREGAWLVADADAKHVLETPAQDAWTAVIRDMGIDPGMLLKAGGVN